MAKKARPIRADRTYTADTNSDAIKRIQKLLKIERGHFPWATFLDEKEVRFVYDMAAQAEAFKAFQPTPAQSRYAIGIIKKLDLAEKTWAKATGKKTASQKPPSTRSDMAARRKAKERLKKANVPFSKATPKDSELISMLETIGITVPTVSGKAIDRLIAWAKKA